VRTFKLTLRSVHGKPSGTIDVSLPMFAGVDDLSSKDGLYVNIRTESAGPGWVEATPVMESRRQIRMKLRSVLDPYVQKKS
jgi:hypothetical protein